jgi:hypothetical protein
VWRFDSIVTTLSSSAAMLVAGCQDGSLWTWRGNETAEGQAAAKRARVDVEKPDFCPVPVVPATAAFVCIRQGEGGAIELARPTGASGVLWASEGSVNLSPTPSGRSRKLLRGIDVRDALILTAATAEVVAREWAAAGGVLLLLADATGALLVAAEGSPVASSRVLCPAEPDGSPVVFLGVAQLEKTEDGSPRSAIVAVWASGRTRVFAAGRQAVFHAGTAVASCACLGNVLVVCSAHPLSPPLLFDLAEAETGSPVPRLIALDVPSCSAVALGEGGRVAALTVAGRRLLVRTVGPLSQLPVAGSGSSGGKPEETVREAVRAVAAQSASLTTLRERNVRANARLIELNAAVQLNSKTLTGSVEPRVQDSGALALAVTIKNSGAANVSADWSVVVAVGNRKVLSSPLPRGLRAGASASIFLGPIAPDTHASFVVRVWLMHLGSFESAVSSGTRFAAGPDLSLAVCERRLGALELCWERRGLVRTCIAPPPPSRCPLHLGSAPIASVSARSFHLAANSEYAAQGGLTGTATLDSLFGSPLSVAVRGGSAAGVAELALSCGGSAAEAAALRAAVARKLLAGVASDARNKSNDWRSVRGQLAALLQRLQECPDAELPALYYDLRRLPAKIL